MAGQRPIKTENLKPAFNFSFNSPDMRARNNKESIYSDSSDDETPRKPTFRGNTTVTPFSAFPKPSQGSVLMGPDAEGFGAPTGTTFRTAGMTTKVKTEPVHGLETGKVSGNAMIGSGLGFGAQTTVSAFSKQSVLDSATSSGGFRGASGISSIFNTASSTTAHAAPVSAFQSSGPQGSQSLSPFGVATQSASTPAGSETLSHFATAALTGQAHAAPVSSFQNTASQASRSLSPISRAATQSPIASPLVAAPNQAPFSAFTKPTTQSGSVLGSTTSLSAPSGTSSLFSTASTTTAQVAPTTPSQNIAPSASLSLAAFGSPIGAPTPAATALKAAMAQESRLATTSALQTEDARLFAAHMKLLDTGSLSQDLHEVAGTPLFTKKVLDHSENLFSQYGFLAGMSNILDSNTAMRLTTARPSRPADPRLFFNISAPSSAFICGSQGSGKSHTLSCLLENCLMKSDVSKLDNPLAGLVFHYDSFTSDVKGTPCEAAHISSNPNVKVRVLVSPTNLQTMKRTYAGLNVTVEPLRINQTDLNTKRMLGLMCVNEEGRMPLYLHIITRILRDMRLVQQQNNASFNYRDFKGRVGECDMTREQLMPLNQRLDTLESFMPQSQISASPVAQPMGFGTNFSGNDWSIKPGSLTIVDLSCPCVTAEGACSIFNICLSLFLEQHTTVGRVIGLDEAHKYMNVGAEASTLNNTLLSSIRLQRHLGTRVFISTQEPTISPKLLDLCSITIVHRFTSPDWLRELRAHIAALDNAEDSPENSKMHLTNIFNQIVKLRTGEALLFAPSAVIGVEKTQKENGTEETEMKILGIGCLKIKIRARVTSDGGRSVFALGVNPAAKVNGNTFGATAVKPAFGATQAASGVAGGIKPNKSPFLFPSINGTNSSVLTAESAAGFASAGLAPSASPQSVTTFGAPSPQQPYTGIFAHLNVPTAANNTRAGFGFSASFDPFTSSQRTAVAGNFATSPANVFSIFSFNTAPAPGTRCAPFQPFIEKEPNSSTNQQNSFQNIGFQLPYHNFSPEELRLADYTVGVRYAGQYKFEGFANQ